VNSLSARCRVLTVCQCQRDKEEGGEEEEEEEKRRGKARKPANEGVGPVFGYQVFYFYSHGRQNAKPSPPSRFGVRKIYFHARKGKHEFR